MALCAGDVPALCGCLMCYVDEGWCCAAHPTPCCVWVDSRLCRGLWPVCPSAWLWGCGDHMRSAVLVHMHGLLLCQHRPCRLASGIDHIPMLISRDRPGYVCCYFVLASLLSVFMGQPCNNTTAADRPWPAIDGGCVHIVPRHVQA